MKEKTGKIKGAILAAGRGTRLRPITTTMPKCMLPLVGRPILEHIINELREAGIAEITIVVGYKKDSIINYFKDGSRLGVKIKYAEQKDTLGTAHAIGLLKFKEDFLVVNGDTPLSSRDIKALISSYKKEKSTLQPAAAAIGVVRVENPANYGVVLARSGFAKKIVEKPKEFISNKANSGVYVFSPEIFNAIKETKKSQRGEYEITTSIQLLIDKGKKVKVSEIKELWSDIGNPWNYLDTNKVLMDRMKSKIEGKIGKFVEMKGSVHVGKNSVIKSGTYIEGPVYVGDNSVVGPNAFLRSYTTIGDNCKIGNGVEIKNSIIMENTNVPHLSYVGDSIIGRNCNFGAGTLVGNLRLDEKSVKMKIGDAVVDSGRRKFGCVVGDNVKTGINVMINSGKKIGSNSMIGPGVIVYDDVPENSFLLMKQELITKPIKREDSGKD